MKTAQHDCDAIICVCVLIYVFLSFSRSLLLLLTQNCFMAARQTFFKRRQLKFKPSPKDTHTHTTLHSSHHIRSVWKSRIQKSIWNWRIHSILCAVYWKMPPHFWQMPINKYQNTSSIPLSHDSVDYVFFVWGIFLMENIIN